MTIDTLKSLIKEYYEANDPEKKNHRRRNE